MELRGVYGEIRGDVLRVMQMLRITHYLEQPCHQRTRPLIMFSGDVATDVLSVCNYAVA